MNEQFTLQDLVELLAQHHQMEQADAEAFVQVFFSLIEEALITDKYVKVKGLGTFKLIDVDSCECIDSDVEEESIEMKNHSRISFTPDATIRDAVNKPFNHFETVLLHETTHYDDMPEEAVSQTLFAGGNTSDKDLDVKSEIPAVPDVPMKKESLTNEATVVENHQKGRDTYLHLSWRLMFLVLLAGILIGGGATWILLSGKRYVPESLFRTSTEKDIKADTVSGVAIADTFSMSSAKREEKNALPVILSDTVRYDMQGTFTTHTLRRGESLARLAEQYYGNRNLWTYLARYNRNRIKDANDIPIGTLICIPKLVPKE